MEIEDGDVRPNNLQKIESLASYDRKNQEDETVPPENLTRQRNHMVIRPERQWEIIN